MSENSSSENENAASVENKSASELPTAEATATQQTTSATEGAKTQEDAAAAETAARAAIVKIEGQEFPLDVAIAADDNLLKAALSPHYPSIKNAQISRETRAGQMIVSIVKKAEHKGSGDGKRQAS
ncbi:MAG: hypothetical protein M3388_07275 [Acidobacteriota bacterium]|nr:hypothetical protein [Acidobacteriota bacterium]